MAQTLLLDTVAWDLVLDANGNIAVASEPYALAQDAASAIRTFLGEVYYDTTIGVDYLNNFGKLASLTLLKAQMQDQAAAANPDIASAIVFIASTDGRVLSGQVQVTSKSTGAVSAANFSVTNPQGVG